jgi:putative DNA primase/helicase
MLETLYARPAWRFPSLEGIVCAPTLRPDGSVLVTPGYDVETGLYLDLNGTTYPPMQTRPTLDHARTAIGQLQGVFIDFPFARTEHFSTVLAAIFSLVARYAIEGHVPLFAVRATTAGSGKGLLIDAISVLTTGRQAPRWAPTLDEDEERKALLTIALAGDAVIHIDNVIHPFGSAPLDLAITAPSISGRMLGQLQSREAPMQVVFFASGNNMVFRGDMARRVVPIDLDPQTERPQERETFTHSPLLPWVLKERPGLVVAALTILKAYVAAGCPRQGITPLGSFEAWSDLVRQALIWAGEADPCAGRQEIEADSDPQYEALQTLLATWYACYGTQAKTVRQVVEDIRLHTGEALLSSEWDALRDALGSLDPQYPGRGLNPKLIGEALRKWKGRLIGGKRFAKSGQGQNPATWRIEVMISESTRR